jgi:hypothetical protein
MQIIEYSVIGTRSAVLRMRRTGTGLEFVIFPMLHVASPEFYHQVTKRLRQCDLIVVEGIGGGDGDARSLRGSMLVSALTLTYRVMPWLHRGRLVEDPIRYRSLGVPLVCPDVSTSDIAKTFAGTRWAFRIMLFLMVPVVAILNLVGGHRHLLSPSVEVNDLPSADDEEFAESEFGEQFEDMVGGDRDDRVMATLGELARSRGNERIDVGVVYGAGHAAKIVDTLHKLGYRLRPSEWIMVLPA